MLERKFIQPINFSFMYNTQHIIVYFKDHREYKSIESRITDDDSGKVYIWNILTRHNGTQVDFVNDEVLQRNLYESNPSREIFYREIKFFQNKRSNKPKIDMWFYSHKNEPIELIIDCATEPKERFGGMMTLPNDFLPEADLPVNCRKISAFISSKSSISISGRRYRIPVKRRMPFFFKEYHGYYSEGYDVILFTKNDEILEPIAYPTEFVLGKSWIYQGKNQVYKYTIYEIDEANSSFMLKRDNQFITVIMDENRYLIKQIYAESCEEHYMTIDFNPPIPIDSPNDMTTQSEFIIEIDGKKKLVTGKAHVNIIEKATAWTLIADLPTWLHPYSVASHTYENEDGSIESKTLLS